MEGGALRPCGGCKEPHDEFGWHPGLCRAGNRKSLWTLHHDAVQQALVWVSRYSSPLELDKDER